MLLLLFFLQHLIHDDLILPLSCKEEFPFHFLPSLYVKHQHYLYVKDLYQDHTYFETIHQDLSNNLVPPKQQLY